jgi:hypothetical protein
MCRPRRPRPCGSQATGSSKPAAVMSGSTVAGAARARIRLANGVKTCASSTLSRCSAGSFGVERLWWHAAAAADAGDRAVATDDRRSYGTDATAAADVRAGATAPGQFGADRLTAGALAVQRDWLKPLELAKRPVCCRSARRVRFGSGASGSSRAAAGSGRRAIGPDLADQGSSQAGSLIRVRNAACAASSAALGTIGCGVRGPVWT